MLSHILQLRKSGQSSTTRIVVRPSTRTIRVLHRHSRHVWLSTAKVYLRVLAEHNDRRRRWSFGGSNETVRVVVCVASCIQLQAFSCCCAESVNGIIPDDLGSFSERALNRLKLGPVRVCARAQDVRGNCERVAAHVYTCAYMCADWRVVIFVHRRTGGLMRVS